MTEDSADFRNAHRVANFTDKVVNLIGSTVMCSYVKRKINKEKKKKGEEEEEEEEEEEGEEEVVVVEEKEEKEEEE